MAFAANPFHTLYLTENVTDIDIPLMFSPVLVPFVAPLYLPGNVVLRGMQGTGKTMLLSLLETGVRLAFWANENKTRRRDKISIGDPLPVAQRRFVGAGINLSKSYASMLNEIVASEDRGENIRLTRAYFGDYVNCWVLRDLLASLEALVTKAPAERREEVGICDDAGMICEALRLMSDDPACSFLRGHITIAAARLALEKRLRAYRGLVNNPRKPLASEIDETRSFLGEPLSVATRALRSVGVIQPDVSVIVTIDQFEQLVRRAQDDGDEQKHTRFIDLIFAMIASRNPEVSYRIGTRPNAIQKLSDAARDYSQVNLDAILQRTEHGRRTRWSFQQCAEDAFRRRIVASKHPFQDEITNSVEPIKQVFGDSPSHAERATFCASKNPDRVIRCEEEWSDEIRSVLEDLGRNDAVAAKLGEAWVRQQISRALASAKKRKQPEETLLRISRGEQLDIAGWTEVESRPWELKAKQWWKKERLPQAVLQVAMQNAQRLPYFGESDIVSLAGENIFVFILICKEIWECDARHKAAAKESAVEERLVPFTRLRQAEGIRDASRDRRVQIAESADGDTLQRFMDVLGQRLHAQLIDDRAMSYPGANGISLAVDDLKTAPEIERLLIDATAECFLLQREHTPKSKSRGISVKWYPHPMLAPFYGLTVPRTKEPLYLNVASLRRWLEVGKVLVPKVESVSSSTEVGNENLSEDLDGNDVAMNAVTNNLSEQMPVDRQQRFGFVDDEDQ